MTNTTTTTKTPVLPVDCVPTKVGTVLNGDGSVRCSFDSQSLEGYSSRTEQKKQ